MERKNMLNHMERIEYLCVNYMKVDEIAIDIVDIFEHGIKGTPYKSNCKKNELVSIDKFNNWIQKFSENEMSQLLDLYYANSF